MQVESLLDVIRDPAERQIVVECLVVISRISESNPVMKIHSGTIDMLKIVRDAVSRHWDYWISINDNQISDITGPAIESTNERKNNISFETNEKVARRMFFDLPQNDSEGSMFYLAESCVRLVFDVRWNGD